MTPQPDDALSPASLQDALADIGEETMQNPVYVALAFFGGALEGAGPELMLRVVTPESAPAWGDFGWLPDMVAGHSFTTRGWRAAGHDDVHYLSLPREDPDAPDVAQAQGDLLTAGLIISLQFRPDLGNEWRVHGIGDYVLPEDMPAIRG